MTPTCVRNIVWRFLFPAALLWVVGFLLPPEASAAPPGIHATFANSPLKDLLLPPPEKSYSMSGKTLPFTPPRPLVKTAVRLEDARKHILFVYRDLGGTVYGLPVVIPLDQFATYKYEHDRDRLLDANLGKEVKKTGRQENALLNITIPVKVPKGLSLITGQGETNIKITGSRRIELSGLSQYTVGQAQTASTRTSKFPTINFDQQSQLNVQGTIGNRITLELQQDSRSQVDLGQSLRLRYNGDEDGIIQSIEAGSTSLTLPGTRLVGFSSGNRGGLFGIKAKAKLGGLDLTMVTTQDKGSSNRRTFQGQTEESANDIRDFQYLKDTYFFLDKVYRDAFPNQPASNDLVDVRSVRVFINDYNDLNDIEQSAFPAVAYAYWNADGTPNITLSKSTNGGTEQGSFYELSPDAFSVDARGYLIMNNGQVDPNYALAVVYQTTDGRKFGDPNFIPNPASSNPVVLKLLKARQQRSDYPTWPLSWRNVYSLGGRDIQPDGFQVTIFQDVSGQNPLDNQNGVPYLQVFKLDTHTNGASQSTPPDNIIDIDGGNNLPGLNLAAGVLVFPQLEPFGDRGVGATALDDASREPDIYSTTNSATLSEHSKFFLRVQSKSRATEYNLGFGIVPNSEEVTLNNRRLVKGQDYTIDYQFGTIRFIGDAATLASDPSANLVINYNTQNSFSFAGQKSLLGIRAEHPFQDNYSLVGLTVLYSNQSATSQRVQVGEEPARTLIWDANARFRVKPEFLTNMVNTIPFVSTQSPSSMTVDMEVAQSLPNPNTQGVAYIDDFEGAQNSQSISIFKTGWTRSSLPAGNGVPAKEGRLTWYNPVERDRISVYDIQPGRTDIPVDQSIVDILDLRFEPATTNGFPVTTHSPSDGAPVLSWGGIMTYLGGWDLSRSKFLEIWVRGNSGKLHIDLGDVSEREDLPLDDAIKAHPSVLDLFDQTSQAWRTLNDLISGSGFRTEDTPLPGLPTGDGVATPQEDIGLDGLTDAQEAQVFQQLFPGVPVPQDPSGDNFKDVDLTKTDILQRYPPGVDGTQGNNSERDSTPDTEDLNKNGILDTQNNYLSYGVDLSDDRGYDPETGQYDGASVLVQGTQSDPSANPWRLIRIPLRGRAAPRMTIGNPDTTFASVVDFARLRIDSPDTTTVQIYTMNVVGSDWLENDPPVGQQSGDFRVSTIGTDNAAYQSPPGLQRQLDPTTGLRMQEHSLSLKFQDLYPGEGVSASKSILPAQNYTQYGEMRMFVHGGNPANPGPEKNFPSAGDSLQSLPSPVELYLRFAPISGDTLNYYQYQRRIYRGWSPATNTFHIDLELLTQLKGQLLNLHAAGRASSDTLTVPLTAGNLTASYDRDQNQISVTLNNGTYTVRGNPSLSSIKSFTLGVANRGQQVLNGENEIWVDELVVDKIRKKSAISALVNVQTVLADLGSFSLNMERRSGDFQDLQGQATGNTTSLLTLNGHLNLQKFLPEKWNTSLPVDFNYNRNSSVPRLRPGSDIVLTQAEQQNESDVSSQSRFNISFQKRAAREAPRLLAQIFFDHVSASLNYATNHSESGAITRRTLINADNINGNFSYDVTWPQQAPLKPFGWVPFYRDLKDTEFFILPTSIRYDVRFNRNQNDQRSFSAVPGDSAYTIATANETFTMNEDYRAKITPFRSLTADYDLAINRDLRNGFNFTQLQFGHETGRTQAASVNYTPRLSRWFSLNTQYSANYRENLETGGQPTVYGNERRGLTVGSTSTASARVGFNLPSLFRPLARPSGKAGFSVFHLIGKAGMAMQTLQTSYSRTQSSNLFGLRSRPSLKFQLGLVDTANVPSYQSGSITRVNTRTIADRANASTGIRLPAGINLQTSANYNYTQNFGSVNTEQKGTEFPNVSAAWRGQETFPVLRWFLTTSSVNFSYTQTHTLQGEGGLGPLFLTSDTRASNLNPLFAWSARLKNQMSITIRDTRNQQTALRYQRNISDTTLANPLTDRLIGTTITNQSQFSSELRYSLSSHLFRKLQSNLDFTLGFNTSSNLQKELPKSVPGTPVEPVVRQDQSTWSATLGAQYQFSSRFTGGINFRHQRQRDHLRNLTNMIWEFKLWGEIRFD